MEIPTPGKQARLIQPEIRGEVTNIRLNGPVVEAELKYTTPDGEEHIRFFPAADLEEIPVKEEEVPGE